MMTRLDRERRKPRCQQKLARRGVTGEGVEGGGADQEEEEEKRASSPGLMTRRNLRQILSRSSAGKEAGAFTDD